MVVVVVRVMAMNSTMMNASEANEMVRTTAWYRCKLLDGEHSLYGCIRFEVKGIIKDHKLFVVEILQDVLEILKNEGHDFFGVELITKQEYDWAVERYKNESDITTRCF